MTELPFFLFPFLSLDHVTYCTNHFISRKNTRRTQDMVVAKVTLDWTCQNTKYSTLYTSNWELWPNIRSPIYKYTKIIRVL